MPGNPTGSRPIYAARKLGYVQTVIPNGQSISGSVQLPFPLIQIGIPAGFTGTEISFYTSPDGVTWEPLYRDSGDEVLLIVTAIPSNIILATTNPELAECFWLQIQAGTVASPVNQVGNQTLTLQYIIPP